MRSIKIGAATILALGALGAAAIATRGSANGVVAFVRTPSAASGLNAPPGDLWIMEADGSAERRLVRGVANAAFSADGRRILLTRGRAGTRVLAVADADGGALRALTRPGAYVAADFSQDSVVFSRLDSGPRSLQRFLARPGRRTRARLRYGLYTMGLDGGAARRLATIRGRYVTDLSASADGTVAVVGLGNGASSILAVPAAGGRVTRVGSFSYRRHGTLVGLDHAPRGDRLALAFSAPRAGIHTISADGGAPRRVFGTDEVVVSPVWAPDGTTIAFTLLTASGAEEPSAHTYTVEATGGRATRLGSSRAVTDVVSWQPLP